MKKVVIVFLAALAMVACDKGARVRGLLVCGDAKDTIYLESISAAGKKTVDSVPSQNSKFSFKVRFDGGQSAIYDIRCKHGSIPLVLSPGEKVKVTGVGNIARNYTVEGSGGSEQIRQLSLILNNGAARLDSLSNIYAHLDAADTTRNGIAQQYARAYYATKRDQIRFIVTNPGTLAAVYGLYQRLPNDNTLFNGAQSDVVYFRLVADSLEAKNPDSPYLKALRSDINRMSLDGMLMNMDALEAIKHPDLELPDMYGKKVKLSSLQGKVVLVDFWSASLQQCRLLNAELKETYDRLHGQGFEVYQVSLDVDKPTWVNVVQEQKLPWATLCDFRGRASAAAGLYNVAAVPANFLLDREGNLVGRNLYGKELETKIKQLL